MHQGSVKRVAASASLLVALSRSTGELLPLMPASPPYSMLLQHVAHDILHNTLLVWSATWLVWRVICEVQLRLRSTVGDCREGSGLPPLARREGQDGSGQLSSNGDWPGDPRERLAAAHAISDTSSQHDHTFSPPDSRTHSLRDYAHPLPPVGEGHDEREHSGALDGSLQPNGDPQGSGAA